MARRQSPSRNIFAQHTTSWRSADMFTTLRALLPIVDIWRTNWSKSSGHLAATRLKISNSWQKTERRNVQLHRFTNSYQYAILRKEVARIHNTVLSVMKTSFIYEFSTIHWNAAHNLFSLLIIRFVIHPDQAIHTDLSTLKWPTYTVNILYNNI